MPQQIIVNNLLVSYNAMAGQEQGNVQTLLFLHGWRSQKEIWNSVVDQVIKSSSHQVYTLDLPGFGGSPAPKDVWTVGDYARLVNGFIEKLNLKNVVIVGHSFGGRVGIKLAAQFPLAISKLVLVDSAGFPMNSDKKQLMNFGAKLAKPFFKPKFMQGLRKKIYKHIGAEDYIATPELQKTFVNVVGEDLTSDMVKIACPTLIFIGELDKDTPIEFAKKMQSLIHNSKFFILPNAGHFSFLDKPEGFATELRSFIM